MNSMTQKMIGSKDRSHSNAETMNRYNRSGQKLKISMVKSDKFHPMFAEIL